MTVATSLPRLLAAILAQAPMHGCLVGSDDSCGYATDEISVVAVAVDNGATVRAEIDFDASDRSAFPHPIALCEADELTVMGKRPERTDRADRIVYSVNLSAEEAPRDVAFVLERNDRDETIDLAVPLPPAFIVTAPTPTQMISRATDLMLAWQPANPGATIRISLTEEIGSGICLQTPLAEHDYKSMAGVDVDDTGTWLVPTAAVQGEPDAECDAVYTFTRYGTAAYPQSFSLGGYLESRVERAVAFRSLP